MVYHCRITDDDIYWMAAFAFPAGTLDPMDIVALAFVALLAPSLAQMDNAG